MSQQSANDLEKFLKPFPAAIQEMTHWLRDFVWDLYPCCTELIYDNYNGLAIGFSTSDKSSSTFCSIAVYHNHVNFGFNFGFDISDPKGLLEGENTQYRKMTVSDRAEFPTAYMKKLLEEAYGNSLKISAQNKQLVRKKSLIKTTSPLKRHPKK